MAFQTGTSASSGAYRDILVSLTAFATSQHVSAAAINGAGTGYAANDVLTITHAGAYLDCKIEVLTVGGSGDILTFAIRSSGAFSNRVATVAINVAGTGYGTNDIVRLENGTFTEFCKIKIDTQSSGIPSAISIFETGGAYTVAPGATAETTDSDIGTGTGSGLTVNTTMTGLIGTTAISATGGTGSGATFDLTLTATGWSATTAAQNRNDYSFNSITDEKELILQGTVAGGDEPYIGIRSYTGTSGIDTRYGWLLAGMDSFNSSLTFENQPNLGPQASPSSNTGSCLLMFDDAQDWWMSVDARRMIVVIKAVGASITSYMSMYAGLMNPFGTQTEVPYPLYVSASTSSHIRPPDTGGFFATGLTELFADLSTTSPAFFRRQSDGAWTRVTNSQNGTATDTHTLYPLGLTELATGSSTDEYHIASNGQLEFHLDSTGSGVSQEGGGAATEVVMPSIGDNELMIVPATVISTPNATGPNDSETKVRGELSGVYWCPATKSDGTSIAAEDYVDISGVRYFLFQNAHRTERYSYFALEADV